MPEARKNEEEDYSHAEIKKNAPAGSQTSRAKEQVGRLAVLELAHSPQHRAAAVRCPAPGWASPHPWHFPVTYENGKTLARLAWANSLHANALENPNS